MYLFSLALVISVAVAVTIYDEYDFDPLEHLAGIAPYWEPGTPPRSPNPPDGCTVTRAAYLVRHAAINSNDFDYETYIEPFLSKLENSSNTNWGDFPALSFLSTWFPPSFGEQERVTRVGKLEATQLGVEISFRYPNFRIPGNVWSSTADRTITTAKSFIQGYDSSINLTQIDEGSDAGADSLTPYKGCPAYSSSTGSDQSSTYLKKWTAPSTNRLNSVFPSVNFTSNDLIGMMELCGYETVIRGSSPFCDLDLFSPDAWLSFEYTNDLMYFYNTGYGNPTSGYLGFPWLNASLSALTADTADQDLYLSFTHRELPPTVLVAMGLFNNTQFSGGNPNASMPLDQINYNRAWVSSKILPFLTNIAIERMNCSSRADSFGDVEDNDDKPYYRVLVNESPQTLPGCFDGPDESCSQDGIGKWLQERADLFSGFSEACGVEAGAESESDVLTIYQGGTQGNSSSRG